MNKAKPNITGRFRRGPICFLAGCHTISNNIILL